MSSQLAELKKLYTREKEYPIGDALITIHTLSLDDMGLFDIKKEDPPEKQLQQTKELLAKCLNVKAQDLASLSVEYLEQLMNAIMDAHGMKESNNTDRIKKMIEERQAKRDKEEI